MIGDEIITRWITSQREHELLHVLSPTDSARDRLAAFLHWNDFSALEQALAVCAAQRREIDVDVIRAWCVHEGQLDKYELFRSRLDG